MIPPVNGNIESFSNINIDNQTHAKKSVSDKICTIAKYALLTLGAALLTAAAVCVFTGVMMPVVYGLSAGAVIVGVAALATTFLQRGKSKGVNPTDLPDEDETLSFFDFGKDPSLITLPEGKHIENGMIHGISDDVRDEVMEHLIPFDVETRYPNTLGEDIGCQLTDSPVVQFYRDDHTPETGFLGNFHEPANGVTISFDGTQYRFTNAEAAFQAVKVWYSTNLTDDKKLEELQNFQTYNGDEAFRAARNLGLQVHGDWHHGLKQKAMYHIVKEKFLQNPDIASKLIEIEAEYLVENTGNIPSRGNYPSCWAISTKGKFEGQGDNLLGIILESLSEDPEVVEAGLFG